MSVDATWTMGSLGSELDATAFYKSNAAVYVGNFLNVPSVLATSSIKKRGMPSWK